MLTVSQLNDVSDQGGKVHFQYPETQKLLCGKTRVGKLVIEDAFPGWARCQDCKQRLIDLNRRGAQ